MGADKAKLTDNNIGVNNDNGKLKVQLSKDLDLTNDGSVKIGDTKVNNDGLTINGGPSVKKKMASMLAIRKSQVLKLVKLIQML